ncbi:SurA N-terminal domain-containing protein [Buchnera aphidicola]|uniref:SurA N-terminal domain-containing protein n=1 Tax=Buchnera aphidicola TaxID=9 RepID=UPI003BEF0830
MIKKTQFWSKNIIIKCILGLIILSIVMSTVISYLPYDTKKYIVTVNGKKISFETVQNMYILEREKQKKILGNKFFKIGENKDFINATYNYILSQLINNILLEQYAEKLQLTVEDKEIKKFLLSSPLFQKNNTFNKQKYFNYLSSIGLQNNEYIKNIKTRLITKKLIDTINNTNFLLKNENKNIIKLLSQKRIIQKSILNIESIIQQQKIKNKEKKIYFLKNKNQFYIPEKFKISYIPIDVKNIQLQYNEKDIEKWYYTHIKDYSQEEKKKYSIIQVKTMKEALSILSQIKKCNNFEDIAKKKSTDPISSSHGGNIGWISNNFIPNEIKKSHLYKKNQISNIIPFQKEFLIIKLNDIQINQKKKLSEVHDSIRIKIINQNSKKSYHILKNKIINIIKMYPNQFDMIIKNINIHPKETNWFTKNSLPQEFNNNTIINKILSDKKLIKKENQLRLHSGLITLNKNTSFIISIKDYKKKEIKKFKDVDKNIIYTLKYLKAMKNIQKKAEKIVLLLRKGKKYNIHFYDPQIISQYEKNNIVPIVFSLPYPKKNKKIYTMIKDKNGNIIILYLSKIYQSNFSFQNNEIIKQYLENNNTEIILRSILKNLYQNANIVYEKI